MDERLRSCLFKKLAINGFSILEGHEKGTWFLMVRGSESLWPETRVILVESDDSLSVMAVWGKFRGRTVSVLTCQQCGFSGMVAGGRGVVVNCPRCGSSNVALRREDINKWYFKQNLAKWTIECKATLF